MHNSPLILHFYFIKKVRFELKPGFDEDFDRDLQNVAPPKLKIDVKSEQNSENQLSWRVELGIEADEKASEKKFPYIFNLSIVGFFTVDENYPTENAEMLAKINAPSVLYSAAREFLANLTGRSPYSAILLPSVSFVPEPQKARKRSKKISDKPKTRKKDKL